MKYILFIKNPKFVELVELKFDFIISCVHYRLIQPRQRFASWNAYKR
jgi:hypothetical protein